MRSLQRRQLVMRYVTMRECVLFFCIVPPFCVFYSRLCGYPEWKCRCWRLWSLRRRWDFLSCVFLLKTRIYTHGHTHTQIFLKVFFSQSSSSRSNNAGAGKHVIVCSSYILYCFIKKLRVLAFGIKDLEGCGNWWYNIFCRILNFCHSIFMAVLSPQWKGFMGRTAAASPLDIH